MHYSGNLFCKWHMAFREVQYNIVVLVNTGRFGLDKTEAFMFISAISYWFANIFSKVDN